MGEMFWASRGAGAFNATDAAIDTDVGIQRMAVSHVAQLSQAVIATGFPYQRTPGSDNNLTEFSRVMPFVQGIRRCGAASLDLALVAAGRVDGYWEFHLSPWDALAGVVMVREAGGQVSLVRARGAMYGAGGILATNGHVHEPLQALLLGDVG
jgi:myo-inositol-1(or 4)-monophosphatase